MNIDGMITLESMVVYAFVIAATGTSIAHLFRNADSPYLITITGSRLELIFAGALVWSAAIGIGVATLLIVAALTSPMIALAVFFGVEAVALDICANRTRYVRISTPPVAHARVRVTLPFSS